MTPAPGPTVGDGSVPSRAPGQDIDAQTVLGRDLRQAFRGYHMDDVDTLLGLVADAIAERDERIAELSARLQGDGAAPAASEVASPTAWTPGNDAVAVTSAPATPTDTDTTDVPAPSDVEPSPAATEEPSSDDAATGSDVVPVLTATRQRRRALVPSTIMLVIAAAALLHGALTGMLETLVAAAVASGTALVGVGVALILTRGGGAHDEDDEFDWS